MKFRDIFGAEEAGIRRYSNDDKPKRAEIAPFERVRITLVTLPRPRPSAQVINTGTLISASFILLRLFLCIRYRILLRLHFILFLVIFQEGVPEWNKEFYIIYTNYCFLRHDDL